MNAVRFHTVIGEDGIIRPPQGVELARGAVEVIILQPAMAPEVTPPAPKEHLFDRLAALAEKFANDTSDLPTDLAENHDHYLHGLPKGIDKQ